LKVEAVISKNRQTAEGSDNTVDFYIRPSASRLRRSCQAKRSHPTKRSKEINQDQKDTIHSLVSTLVHKKLEKEMKFSIHALALLAMSSPYLFQNASAFTVSFLSSSHTTRNHRMPEKSLQMALEGVELLKTQSNYLQDPLLDVRLY